LDENVHRIPIEEATEEKVDESDQAQLQAAEYLDQLQRSQAEFANYKKRIEREREQYVSLANAALIHKLLPILDDLERALETIPDSLRGLTWVEGVALIERRLRMTLEQEGLTEIESVGKKFNPELHHAVVRQETTEHAEDEIIGELQKGYKLHDKVLRPSMVRVAANPIDEDQTNPAGREDN
jgi:molecular chaperone GrpE